MNETASFVPKLNLDEVKHSYDALKAEFAKVIVGQETLIDYLVVALFTNGHVLLEGNPGVAKTLTAKCLAKMVSADFSRIQFTPDLMPTDITGTMIYNNKTMEFEFRRGPVFSNIILIDEINRAPAKTQSALFEAMEENQVTVDGKHHPLEYPFMIIATQNPIDQEGTYSLPEAQLDRFLFKVIIDYPSIDEEVEILKIKNQQKQNLSVESVNAIIDVTTLKKIRTTLSDVFIKDELLHYISKIIGATRKHGSLYIGASPRASVNILNASKAFAAINGRDFVTPDDIKTVLLPILNHRITLTPEKEMEGQTTKTVLDQILQQVDVPR